MSCTAGPNAAVISLLSGLHGTPVLLGRSVFHEEKARAGKGKANPAPTTVARWLRTQRKQAATDTNINKDRLRRILAQTDTLIKQVESGDVVIDAPSFAGWKALADRLANPTNSEEELPPIVAHRIRDRVLLSALPDTQPEDLTQVRQAFARFITYHARRDGINTWQEAWNAFTGATPETPGKVRYRPHQCSDCGGFGYLTKNATNADGQVIGSSMLTNYCPICRGTGRPRGTMEARAEWIAAPTQP